MTEVACDWAENVTAEKHARPEPGRPTGSSIVEVATICCQARSRSANRRAPVAVSRAARPNPTSPEVCRTQQENPAAGNWEMNSCGVVGSPWVKGTGA